MSIQASTDTTNSSAVLLDSDDLAVLLGFKGTTRQRRKQVYGLLQREGQHFGVFSLNGRLVCMRSRVMARLEYLAEGILEAA